MNSLNDGFNDSGISGGEAQKSLTNLNSSGNNNNRSILKELNANDCSKMLSPLTPTAAKQTVITAASNKMTTSPSPHSKDTSASVLMSPAPVASSVVVGSVASDSHKENPFLSLINNSADLDNSFTKFSGLPEFDECEIPELSSGLIMNSELDDPLGLTFEDGLIPTLTAKMNQHLNSTAAKDDSNNKTQLHQQLLVVANETDTAVSSDNETFAECQTFQEDDSHQHDVVNNIGSENIQDFSEADSYFSAVNSNVTITNATIDQMSEVNATLGNVVEDIQVQLSSTEIKAAATITTNVDDPNLANATFDDYEPMDVDMSFSEVINIQNDAESVQQQVDSTQQHVAAAGNVQHIIDSHSEGNTTTATHSAAVSEIEMEQSKHEESLDKSIELPTCSSREKKRSSESIIQDNRIDSATDNLSAATIKDTEANMVPEIAVEHEADGNAEALTSDVIVLKEPSSSLDVSAKLSNLTLDLTSSFSSSKGSAPSSPTFPVKSSLKDVKEFPRSLPIEEKHIAYLEKSEYSEHQHNCTVKKPVITLSTVVYDNQQSTVQQNGTANLNNTIDLCTPEKNISTVPNGDGMLNGSFNGNSSSSASDVVTARSSIAEFPGNLSVNSRLTFGTTPITEADAAESVQAHQEAATSSLNVSDAAKRRTFNVNDAGSDSLATSSRNENRYTFGINLEVQSPSIETSPSTETKRRTFNVAAEPNEQLYENFEAMDVDDALLPPPPTTAATFPISPPIPAVLKCQIEEDISERKQVTLQSEPVPAMQQRQSKDECMQMPPPPQSPPVPTILKRNAEREMVQMPSEFPSPPLPALQKSQPEEETMQTSHLSHSQSEEEIKQMPPPSQSPPIPTLQKRQSVEEPMHMPQPSQSPPIPTLQKRNSEKEMVHMPSEYPSPPLPSLQKRQSQEKEDETAQMPPPAPKSYIQKRPSIHTASTGRAADLFTKPAALEKLSVKEQTKSNAKDEKDIFIDKTPSPLDEMFMTTGAGAITKTSTATSESNAFSGFGIGGGDGDSDSFHDLEEFSDADFRNGSNLILNPSDFDYLLTKGNNNAPIDRSSILLKFDPLLGVPIAPNQPQRQQQILQQILVNNNSACLSPTFEEDEQRNESGAKTKKSSSSPSFGINSATAENTKSNEERQRSLAASAAGTVQEKQLKQQAAKSKKYARMSVDLIDNDCNKTFENSNSQSDEKHINYKMDDLEKKIKNEVLKTEDIEKKLKEAEQREEALIKRITEKDKTISKMNGVIEAYEKAIAELIAEKEQLIQNYEKQLAEVKADRDSNYHHLTSLETTFSDLHVKYEKSKEMTLQLKSNEESLLAEKRQNLEYLRLQEQRYDKMKNHAMQQLEIANKKLESLTKEHSIESTKLKALLKKEEISRASINEQLQQKSRENAELMTICDELINGQGS